MKRTPLRRSNSARKRKRYTIAFGSKADWVRSLPCLVCGAVPSDPAHVRSRGAGGTAADIVPLCRAHHSEQHAVGVRTFSERHGLDLRAEADGLEEVWTREVAA